MKRKNISDNTFIVPDDPRDDFTESDCNCDICQQIHSSIKEWDTFTATTSLQKGMKKIVAKIENDIQRRKKRRKTSK